MIKKGWNVLFVGCITIKTALILAGGKATRLGEDLPPKAMLNVQGKTLIDWQIDFLQEEGFDNIILCLGHRSYEVKPSVQIVKQRNFKVINEEDPLGTGGAVRLAFERYPDMFRDGVYILNVDDLCRTKWSKFRANRPCIIGQKLPFSIWISGTMFAQNEATRHIGHTFLPLKYVEKLPKRCSLEQQLAKWSKEDKVEVRITDNQWITVNDNDQLREANLSWKG